MASTSCYVDWYEGVFWTHYVNTLGGFFVWFGDIVSGVDRDQAVRRAEDRDA